MNAFSSLFSSKQTHDHEAFVSRAASIDQLIDAKGRFVMESARLQAVAESNPELRDKCDALIKILAGHIETLQEQIDRHLQGLLYSIQKSPAPSRLMDNVPG